MKIPKSITTSVWAKYPQRFFNLRSFDRLSTVKLCTAISQSLEQSPGFPLHHPEAFDRLLFNAYERLKKVDEVVDLLLPWTKAYPDICENRIEAIRQGPIEADWQIGESFGNRLFSFLNRKKWVDVERAERDAFSLFRDCSIRDLDISFRSLSPENLIKRTAEVFATSDNIAHLIAFEEMALRGRGAALTASKMAMEENSRANELYDAFLIVVYLFNGIKPKDIPGGPDLDKDMAIFLEIIFKGAHSKNGLKSHDIRKVLKKKQPDRHRRSRDNGK